MYPLLKTTKLDIFQLGSSIPYNEDNDPFVRSLGIQLVSIFVEESGELANVAELFEQAAKDNHWEVR